MEALYIFLHCRNRNNDGRHTFKKNNLISKRIRAQGCSQTNYFYDYDYYIIISFSLLLIMFVFDAKLPSQFYIGMRFNK